MESNNPKEENILSTVISDNQNEVNEIKNMDYLTLQKNFINMKKRILCTQELIFRDKNLGIENRILKKKLKSLISDNIQNKNACDKLRDENNKNSAKVIKLTMDNEKLLKQEKELNDKIEEQRIKIDGDAKYIQQLQCKIEDGDNVLSDKLMVLELEKSNLQDEVKKLQVELRKYRVEDDGKKKKKKNTKVKSPFTNKKNAELISLSENEDDVQSIPQKINYKLDIDLSPVKVLPQINLTEPDKKMNHIKISFPDLSSFMENTKKVNVVTKNQSIMTDEFYNTKDNPYPLFCDKCKGNLEPLPVEMIQEAVMKFPPLLDDLPDLPSPESIRKPAQAKLLEPPEKFNEPSCLKLMAVNQNYGASKTPEIITEQKFAELEAKLKKKMDESITSLRMKIIRKRKLERLNSRMRSRKNSSCCCHSNESNSSNEGMIANLYNAILNLNNSNTKKLRKNIFNSQKFIDNRKKRDLKRMDTRKGKKYHSKRSKIESDEDEKEEEVEEEEEEDNEDGPKLMCSNVSSFSSSKHKIQSHLLEKESEDEYEREEEEYSGISSSMVEKNQDEEKEKCDEIVKNSSEKNRNKKAHVIIKNVVTPANRSSSIGGKKVYVNQIEEAETPKPKINNENSIIMEKVVPENRVQLVRKMNKMKRKSSVVRDLNNPINMDLNLETNESLNTPNKKRKIANSSSNTKTADETPIPVIDQLEEISEEKEKEESRNENNEEEYRKEMSKGKESEIDDEGEKAIKEFLDNKRQSMTRSSKTHSVIKILPITTPRKLSLRSNVRNNIKPVIITPYSKRFVKQSANFDKSTSNQEIEKIEESTAILEETMIQKRIIKNGDVKIEKSLANRKEDKVSENVDMFEESPKSPDAEFPEEIFSSTNIQQKSSLYDQVAMNDSFNELIPDHSYNKEKSSQNLTSKEDYYSGCVKELRNRKVSINTVMKKTPKDVIFESKSEKEPREIENHAESKTVLSMLFSYCSSVRGNHQKEANELKKVVALRLAQETEELIKTELKRLTDTEIWDEEIQCSVLAKLAQIGKPSSIVKAIAEFITDLVNPTETLDRSHTPPAPLMTKKQQKIVNLLVQLESIYPQIILNCLNFIEYSILELGKVLDLNEIQELARIFVILARIKKDRERVRMMCCDALYFFPQKGQIVIHVILTSWPEVLPTFDQSQNQILPSCIAHLIKSYQPPPKPKFTKFDKIMQMKNLVKQYHGYTDDDPLSVKLLEAILSEIRSGKEDLGVCTALVLLCKSKGPDWTYQKVINDDLLRIITDRKQPNNLKLIANILKIIPVTKATDVIDKTIDIMTSVLKSESTDDRTQESAVSGLLSLARFRYLEITNVILSWKVPKELSPLLNKQLQDFFASKTPTQWNQTRNKIKKINTKKLKC